jgi:iron(II)-dependent oxidoreductase
MRSAAPDLAHEAQRDTWADRLAAVRARTLALVAAVPREAIDRRADPLLSPLAWDLGHIAAFEDLWLAHRAGGLPLLRPELAEVYDAFETPRAVRSEVPYLRGDDALAYLEAVRARSLGVLVDAFVVELVAQHELQHQETMLQALRVAGRPLPAFVARPGPVDGGPPVPIAARRATVGAPDDGFAYDNERPRHEVELAAFAITPAPVRAGEWQAWIDDGGYARREWWSDEGWAWRRAEGAEGPRYWTAPMDPDHPVAHVSCFEAEAFARAHGARLPTEAEWETAHRAGALRGVGAGWEWTATEFDGYPGFRAHPYREYSEVFFRRGHRVLRGASPATHESVARPSFRNWDLPQRRQIFTTVRLVWSA